ncbi:MAG: ArsI/CadI family heavy metal resistance metalloenzyme [Crocinitomicaceae bacterium]
MKKEIFPRMHVSCYVKDLDQTIAFYNQFFGKEPDKIKEQYTKYVLESPSLIISFIENKDRVMANFGHLGFQVETKEELEQKLQIAKAQGIVSIEEIGTSCCYAEQDKFWVTDPSGIQWEVYYFHKDVEFNDPKYADSMASQCCSGSGEQEQEQEQERLGENENEKKKLKLVDVKQDNSVCVPGNGCC